MRRILMASLLGALVIAVVWIIGSQNHAENKLPLSAQPSRDTDTKPDVTGGRPSPAHPAQAEPHRPKPDEIHEPAGAEVEKPTDQVVGSREKAHASIAADGFHFTLNRGEGLRQLRSLELSEDDLGDYQDPLLLHAILLDTETSLELKNEALNGLRLINQPRDTALKRAIVMSTQFDPDCRIYVTQHLALWCQTIPEGDSKRRTVMETIGAFADKAYPVGVRREALFGLANIPQTQNTALVTLEQLIENGAETDFGDLYLRICAEAQIDVKPTLKAKLGVSSTVDSKSF